MSPTVCYLDSDASSARLLTDGADRTWEADPPEEGEGRPHPAEEARRNVADAAAWVAEQIAPGKRIDLVCIGVDESLCTWMSAPSTDMQVVTAAVRQRQQGWGDSFSASLVQPLARGESAEKPKSSIGALIEKRRKGGQRAGARKASAHLAVLQLQDGPARLWLDHLDASGVRIGAVTSLWHAMARAWGRPPAPKNNGSPNHPAPRAELAKDSGQPDLTGERVVASVLLESEGRLIWAWSVGGALVGAGRVAGARHRSGDLPGLGPGGAPDEDDQERQKAVMLAACARLTLDWLTWSAQLGRRPDEVVLIGRHVDQAAPEVERLWHGAELRLVEEDDPIAATLGAIGAETARLSIEGADPRQAVVDLTRRPSRSLRRLYLWSSAALVLLGVGVGGIGLQFRGWAEDLRRQAQQRSEEIQSAMQTMGVSAPRGLEVRTMRSELERMREEAGDFREPQPPLPILDELMRLAEHLEGLRDEEGVQVSGIEIDDASANATIRTSEFAPLEQLRAELTNNEGLIRWRGQIEGSPPNVSLRLNGLWELSQ